MTAAGSRLELVWPSKDQFLLVSKNESGKPVWVERDHPAASEVRLTEGQRPLVQDLVRETGVDGSATRGSPVHLGKTSGEPSGGCSESR